MFFKKFRKQSFIAVVLSVCLMMNFTYTAFAVDEFPQGFVPPSWINGNETYMGTFDLTNFSSEEREIWASYIKSPYGLYWLSYMSDLSRNQTIRFYLLEPDVTIESYSPPYQFCFKKSGVPTRYPYFEFIHHGSNASKPQTSRKWTPQPSGSGYIKGLDTSTPISFYLSLSLPTGADVLIGGDFLVNNTISESVTPFVKTNPLGDIHFLYIPVEQPPEPTPTPTLPPVEPPAPPEVTQPPIDYPTFPKVENIYIPYDTTVWNEFAHRIRSSIGSSTNIGFTVFAIVLGIFVVIRIIRTFAGLKHSRD